MVLDFTNGQAGLPLRDDNPRLPHWLLLMPCSLVFGCISFLFYTFAKALASLLSSNSSTPPQAPYLKAEKGWNGLPKSYSRYMEDGYREVR